MRALSVALVACGVPLFFGCSSKSDNGAPHVGHGAPDGGAAVSTGPDAAPKIPDGTEGTNILGCTPSCPPPQHCSMAAFTCLDPGKCLIDADCAGGQKCDAASGTCAVGGDCGEVQFGLERITPNVLILLDRSGSMDDDAGGDSRWNVAKSAIAELTAQWGDQIRFGLATYSSCLPGGCSPGSVVTPIGDGTAKTIDAFLATTVDKGSSDGKKLDADGKVEYLCDSDDPETSTGKSLAALVGEKPLLEAGHTNAVILLTDGAETKECVDDCDGPCGAKRLLDQSPSVKTYVIGLGVNGSAVDAIAKAGGTTASIPTKNLGELAKAFDQVATSIASCDYTLGMSPPDTGHLYVYFDDDAAPLPQDGKDGWSYAPDTRRFTLNGSACDRIKGGSVQHIDVVFGCPRPVVK
jgi:hypothetical protein